MKRFILIGAILLLVMLAVSPASAVWHNGVSYTDEKYSELIDGATVIHNGQTGVDSKYRPVDNGVNTFKYSCDLPGTIRAHTNTLSPEVLLSNDINPNVTTAIPILPDGSFEFNGLAYGNYTLTLLGDAGNGGQTETAKVVCAAPGGVVYPQTELLGHAVQQINYISPMTVSANIDGCNVNLNGLKIVKDELITVPGHTDRVCIFHRCFDVWVPGYSYWTYKLEGRVTVKSIGTEITNPNRIPLDGTVTVVVGYTVDKKFDDCTTDTKLRDRTKTFVGTFTSVPSGTTFYDGEIVFHDRINDAIIDDSHFPEVLSSNIVTTVPWGYFLR